LGEVVALALRVVLAILAMLDEREAKLDNTLVALAIPLLIERLTLATDEVGFVTIGMVAVGTSDGSSVKLGKLSVEATLTVLVPIDGPRG
jgi:hypothetical protein